MIKLNFLGTGQAVPTAKRNHTAIFFQYKDEGILLDCGEGTQRQFRIAKLNPCKITRILITHWHGDHVLGLAGLLQTLTLNRYDKLLHVYLPKGTAEFFQELRRLFVPVGRLNIEIHEAEGKFFENADFYLETFKLEHGIPTNSYSFVEKDKLKIDKKKMKKLKLKQGPLIGELKRGKSIKYNGKIIKPKDLAYVEKGKKISFILDTKFTENALKAAKNADLLVCESTYTKKEIKLAKEYKHLTAGQAAMIAKKAKVKRLILTHLSQRYEHDKETVLKEAKKVFKNSSLAFDFMKVEV